MSWPNNQARKEVKGKKKKKEKEVKGIQEGKSEGKLSSFSV